MQNRQEFASYLVNECNLAPATAWTYHNGLKRLEVFCGKAAEHLDAQDVRRFLRESTYHPATKNATLVAAKAFHRWGHLEGYWELNGLMSVRGPRQIRDPKPSLSPAEARTLLKQALRPTEMRLVGFGLLAGCRVSEAASIGEEEWLEDRLRFVGKGRKMREVPIHPDLAARKNIILSRSPTADTLKSTCRALSFLLGTPFTSHALRRTFGVTLSEAGVDRDTIGSLLGHAPGSVLVQAYVPIRWSEKCEAIARLNYS